MNFIINIVEEDPGVARAAVTLLKAAGFSINVFEDADDYLKRVDHRLPSLTLVSFGLTDQGAARILADARTGNHHSTIVMTTSGVDASSIVHAIKSGAEDVIEKPFRAEALVAMVQRLMSPPEPRSDVPPPLPSKLAIQLTAEEQQILALMEQGATIKQIAARLDISVRTIHYRKATILQKTECKSCTEVIAKLSAARSQGTIPRPHLPPFDSHATFQKK